MYRLMNRLTERITLQRRPPRRSYREIAGAAAVAIVGLALGCAAWAQQPIAPPQAVWTPSSDAPAGLLTSLEQERHDRFIARARAGDLDIVFFGTTSTEMWTWPDRGRSVWDRTFGSLDAASFGSQGTRFESLLWRMRNGELDGYRAKLVVLHAFYGGDHTVPDDRAAVAGYAALIAEIRARQPQANILIFADFPRGQLSREAWREVAEASSAVLAGLVDDETVFYVDIGERFFRPDGSFDTEMWGMPGKAGVGIQPAAFEVWAEELQPWLDRFVR